MKKVLYISNIEVPYRVGFFNELAKACDLTVLYERSSSSNRDNRWSKSISSKNHKVFYLGGFGINQEYSISVRIIGIINKRWDYIIVGCYNSITQILAIIYMRLFGIKYIINLDGEQFIDNSIKGKIKKFVLKGASLYLTAGVSSGENLYKTMHGRIKYQPYFFSSLYRNELIERGKQQFQRNRNVLVVGQYFDYKGMDVVFKAACMDDSIQYLFVGMGNRTELFLSKMGERSNIRVIPFLQKEDLAVEYRRCGLLVLPSRKECWGLVINEAASFGMPIVSTWGSGAAVEFLSKDYPQYLAKPGDAVSLYNCIKMCLFSNNIDYSNYLLSKSKSYSIEDMVSAHMKVIQ